VPGQSGDSNPHGTPPGQRIPSATTPPTSGGPTPTAAPEFPTLKPGVNPAFECPPNCAAEFQALSRTYAEVARALARVEGWEPRWNVMGEALPEVEVTVRTTETRGGQTRTWTERWRKTGAREWGAMTGWGDHSQEWVLVPGVAWGRFGTGPWRRAAAGPQRRVTDLDLPRARIIEIAWEAEPVAVERGRWGVVTVQFVGHRGAGRMAWEIEEATGLVQRLKAWDGQGQPAWEETREYSRALGRMLMASRHRVDRWGGVQETLAWQAPAGAVVEPEGAP
jgi:hypothetical protein